MSHSSLSALGVFFSAKACCCRGRSSPGGVRRKPRVSHMPPFARARCKQGYPHRWVSRNIHRGTCLGNHDAARGGNVELLHLLPLRHTAPHRRQQRRVRRRRTTRSQRSGASCGLVLRAAPHCASHNVLRAAAREERTRYAMCCGDDKWCTNLQDPARAHPVRSVGEPACGSDVRHDTRGGFKREIGGEEVRGPRNNEPSHAIELSATLMSSSPDEG